MPDPVSQLNPATLIGRRVFAFGPALGSLRAGPLAAADIGLAALPELARLPIAAHDLVIIDADAWEATALAAAIQSLAAFPAPPAVLTVGASLPATLVRSLLRLERSDVLESPFTAEQIVAAVQGLLDAPAPATASPASGGESRCWAVSGAVGGSGATTLAIEMAYALSRRATKERGVCLVDLNLVDGAAAAYLGVNPAMRLAGFAEGADRIDASMLQAFVTPISKGFDLLAGPRDPTAFDAVGRDAVLRILEVACEAYEWVIIDMPRHRRPWTLEVLSGCDEILVVSELTVPALLAARALADETEHALGATLKPRIILNRLASRMFGPAPSMAEAERALQRKADAGVSSDWEAAAASANLGGTIAQHRPKSKIVKDVAQMVDRLVRDSSRRRPASTRAA